MSKLSEGRGVEIPVYEWLGQMGWTPRTSADLGVSDLQDECPGVGLDLIRRILGRLQKEKKVKALGTGRAAKWKKLGN